MSESVVWEGCGIRINHVGALKASGLVWRATEDYYVEGVNWMKVTFLHDRTTHEIPHSDLQLNSRVLTEEEIKRHGLS